MLKMKDTDYVGTGMILKVTKNEESMSFIIVVQGDTSGDGIVTTADAAQVEFHILNKKVLEGASFRAADINRNKAVTGEDLATITRSLQYLEAESVNPNYVEEKTEPVEETKETEKTEEKDKNNKNDNSIVDKNTDKTTKEDTKDNKDKENTNKTDTTKDNKVNETEEKENNTENKTTEKTEDTSSEKVNLPENDTVQYKKQEE